jgi:hypothetical protein
MTTTSSSPFTRALRRLSLGELKALYRRVADGELDQTLEPRERLAAWYRHERRRAFMERVGRLDTHGRQRVYMALLGGEDPEPFLPPLDSGGVPPDGSSNQ